MTEREQKLQETLAEAEAELRRIEERRTELIAEIASLREEEQEAHRPAFAASHGRYGAAEVTHHSAEEKKIRLFRSLFRGREDVYPKRFESARTGKSGYQPDCTNEWVAGVCQKPRVRCRDCANRQFLPVTDDTIRSHLTGHAPGSQRDFTIGVYPLLADDTCWFLAVDFDRQSWQDDALAFLESCDRLGVPTACERSRSGNGAHVWVFFAEALPARLARQLGSLVITGTMERRPELGLRSYDRLFPNQDTVPEGGFGNLIALPLQKSPRAVGNSVFVDRQFLAYPDQWAYLSGLRRMARGEVQDLVDRAAKQGRILGIRLAIPGDDDEEPWSAPPSRRRKPSALGGPLPARVDLVLGNQVYIPKCGLPPALLNQLVRMAAFQNPEFYRKQAMRLPTFDTPRIVGCCEEFPLHIGLPRGCLDEVIAYFDELGVAHTTKDERFPGRPIHATFTGELRPQQVLAADALLKGAKVSWMIWWVSTGTSWWTNATTYPPEASRSWPNRARPGSSQACPPRPAGRMVTSQSSS